MWILKRKASERHFFLPVPSCFSTQLCLYLLHSVGILLLTYFLASCLQYCRCLSSVPYQAVLPMVKFSIFPVRTTFLNGIAPYFYFLLPECLSHLIWLTGVASASSEGKFRFIRSKCSPHVSWQQFSTRALYCANISNMHSVIKLFPTANLRYTWYGL